MGPDSAVEGKANPIVLSITLTFRLENLEATALVDINSTACCSRSKGIGSPLVEICLLPLPGREETWIPTELEMAALS